MLPFLALLTFHAYASTPQDATLRIVSIGVKKPPVVRRVNIAWPYATVLTSGGVMEGSAVTAPILLRHFSFGWQPLDLLNVRCDLDSHALEQGCRNAVDGGYACPAP